MKQANWVRPDCRKQETKKKSRTKTKPESVKGPEQEKVVHNG